MEEGGGGGGGESQVKRTGLTSLYRVNRRQGGDVARDVVLADLQAVSPRVSEDPVWYGWVETQCLVDDGVEVGEMLQVLDSYSCGMVDAVFVKLGTQLLHSRWVL